MDKKIKSAFDSVHAENELKDKTKNYLASKLYEKEAKSRAFFKNIPAIAVCCVVLIIGIFGYFSYSTPVAAISLDINPSVELELNMYDRIISAKGYNDDGVKLAQSVDIKNMSYDDAVDTVINSDIVSQSLEKGNTLEVTVACSSEKRSEKITNSLENKNNISSNCIYQCDNREDVETAHFLGLSFGKYRAYLELKEVNPQITVDDIKGLTMREIRDMINGEEDSSQGQNGNGNGNGNGNSSENNTGNGNGNSSGSGNGSGNQYGKTDNKGNQNGKSNN